MKKRIFLEMIAVLCLCFLVGCSAPAEEENNSEDNAALDLQEQETVREELSTEELQKYFEDAYTAVGNCLDTPEQLSLELAELKNLASDNSLPEDYEIQYRDWRSECIETFLAELQEKYTRILEEITVYDGFSGGMVYADLVDLEGLGKPNLLIVNVFSEDDFTVYGEVGGNIQQYPVDMGNKNVELITGDSSHVSLISHNGKTFIKTQDINGQDLTTIFYKVENGKVQIEAFNYDGSDLAPDSIENEILYSDMWSRDVKIQTRGILPEPSSDIQRKIALSEVLENSGIQYARLADMDGDGKEDLVTVEEISKKNEYTGATYNTPIFRAYIWDGSALQVKNMNQAEDYNDIGGIYREKSTGKIYVNYAGGAGPYSWDYFERISECIMISDEDLSWDEYLAQKNRFELVDDLMWQLPLYDTIDIVRQQLMEK